MKKVKIQDIAVKVIRQRDSLERKRNIHREKILRPLMMLHICFGIALRAGSLSESYCTQSSSSQTVCQVSKVPDSQAVWNPQLVRQQGTLILPSSTLLSKHSNRQAKHSCLEYEKTNKYAHRPHKLWDKYITVIHMQLRSKRLNAACQHNEISLQPETFYNSLERAGISTFKSEDCWASNGSVVTDFFL